MACGAGKHFWSFLRHTDLPRIRFRDLRHTLANVIFPALRTHSRVVQGVFGHKDIKITLDTYTHYLPSMQASCFANLDEIFGEWTGGEVFA